MLVVASQRLLEQRISSVISTYYSYFLSNILVTFSYIFCSNVIHVYVFVLRPFSSHATAAA